MTMPRALRWRPLGHDGLEHLDIAATTSGIHARSAVVGSYDSRPFGAAYTVDLAPDGTFRRLDVTITDGRSLTLSRSPQGDWQLGDRPAPHLAGCVDIDIAVTPFTNTLPIRRTRLDIGVPGHFRMAWIPLDSLVPVVDDQVYTRQSEDLVHYAAADGSFEAELTIDADGFVVDYPGLFRRA